MYIFYFLPFSFFSLWKRLNFSKMTDLCECLLNDVINKEILVRQAAADALADLFNEFPEYVEPTIQKLLTIYHEKLYVSNSLILS